MFKTLSTSRGELNLLATASTAIRYKQIFKEDLLLSMSSLGDSEATTYLDIAQKLGFIMNAQAEKKDMMELSYEKYIEFLDNFEPLEFITIGKDIISAYRMNEAGTSESKKKEDQPSES